MTWFQSTYTARFNSRHRRSGHRFGGRYKAVLVDSKAGGKYFRTLMDYIRLNPVRVGLIRVEAISGPGGKTLPPERVAGNRWSSLSHDSVRPSKRPDWLCCDRGLGVFGLDHTVGGRRRFARRLQAV